MEVVDGVDVVDVPPPLDVVEAAFGAGQGPRVARLSTALATGDAGRACLVAVGPGGDEPVGVVQLSRGWVDAADAPAEVAVLSPLAVRPDRQRTGIGGVLVRAALARAAALGFPAVFLEGDPRYYARFGFVADHGFEAPSGRIPPWAFQVVLLGDLGRGRLVYPDVFWAYDAVGLREN